MGTREAITKKTALTGAEIADIDDSTLGFDDENTGVAVAGTGRKPAGTGRKPAIGTGSGGATFESRRRFIGDNGKDGISGVLGSSESTSAGRTRSTKANTRAPSERRTTTKPKPKTTTSKSSVKKDEGELSPFEFAGGIITALETTASALVNEPVPMDAVPKAFMQASLGNMLSRMDAAQMEQFSRIADPLVLIVCAGVYAAKVINVINSKKAETNEDSNSVSQPQSRNGRETTESGIGRSETSDRGTIREYGFGNT